MVADECIQLHGGMGFMTVIIINDLMLSIINFLSIPPLSHFILLSLSLSLTI